ncbi:MAG TPA: SGNH/GDSL hydrolase family protein [Acidobacteriaceae bacterium]
MDALKMFTRWWAGRYAVAAVSLLMLLNAAQAQVAVPQEFALKSGDRVVFYGDSITAQRLYTRLVEIMVVTRYPAMRVNFYSAGVSGDTVYGGHSGDAKERVLRDVAPFRPSVITVALGANDGHYTLEGADATFLSYQKGYRTLLDLLKQNSDSGVRITLASPVAYDEISRTGAPVTGYNNLLIRYGSFVKQLAGENRYGFADFNHAMTTLLTAETKENPTAAQELYPDHLHPSVWGHWGLAAEMARTWGFDPLVSSVLLDAANAKVSSAQKTGVTELTRTPTGLTWSQFDTALPLPLDIGDVLTQILIESSDIAQLDQQTLQVSGLNAGTYLLMIDGKNIAPYTQQQLAAGVNLALLDTPMEQQARSVDWDGGERRAKLSAIRLNLMAQTPALVGRESAVKTLDALDAAMVDLEYKHAQPVIHHFELKVQANGH